MKPMFQCVNVVFLLGGGGVWVRMLGEVGDVLGKGKYVYVKMWWDWYVVQENV